jgi:effector-binding domain-containing protein
MMTNIKFKQFDKQLIASIRVLVRNNDECKEKFQYILTNVPEKYRIGPPFKLAHYGTAIPKDMEDIEMCIPISTSFSPPQDIKIRNLKPRKVLSLMVSGPFSKDKIAQGYKILSQYFKDHGLSMNSDEMQFEIYHDNNCEGDQIELQIKIHEWTEYLRKSLQNQFSPKQIQEIMGKDKDITYSTLHEDRIAWLKPTLQKINDRTTEKNRYHILSQCAHVFSQERIDQLRAQYLEGLQHTNNFYKAIDAVLDFMHKDPEWYEDPVREGYIIYTKKIPFNPKGYTTATDPLQKAKNYCHCALIRNYIESRSISESFCYCGSGWYRQIWEGLLQQPVEIRLLKSLLKGDEYCQFAIELPQNEKMDINH